MSKNKDRQTADAGTTAGLPDQQAGDAGVAQAQGPNHNIVYRRDHPGNRCSYGIAGVPGIVVFDKGLFVDGIAPPVITFDCVLASPKGDAKAEKAAAAAIKAEEKVAKAKAKIEAAAAKAVERQAKADAALAAAKKRVEDAAAKAAGKTAGDAPQA